ncbi:MAG: flagellar filament capping protein FliD [Ruminiclostridium sp.]|nr:flagellar filament capping protein FliD [Ruminiclostridium sp.]
MANDMIRMSGMNSGLDTESIINALTANSKLKVTKQERNILKYQATQEAYQDISTKITALKNKYFDVLNKDSNLSGTSMWNKYSSKTFVEGEEKYVSGFAASTTINSQAGDYKMKIKSTAKQSTYTGKSLSSNAKISGNTMAGLEADKEYGFTIDVGGEAKNITFKAGADVAATLNNINDVLEKAYGESNASVDDSGNEGMVYAKAGENGEVEFVSRAGKGITFSGINEMKDTNVLNFANAKKGTNTLSLQVGNENVSVSFQTIDKDFFKSAVENGIINTDTGETVGITDTDEEGNNIRFTKAAALAKSELGENASEEEIDNRAAEIRAEWSEAVTTYRSVTDDLKESVRYDSFKSWKENASEEDINNLFGKALEKQEKTLVSGWLEGENGIKEAYDSYVEGLGEGETADDIYTWAQNSEEEAVQTKFAEFTNKYHGTTETEEKLQQLYQTYTEGLEEGEEAKSYDDWKADHIENNSYHLNKESWKSSEHNMFTAYKENVYTESPSNYDLSQTNVVNHFIKSSLKNSIGNLETASGVKFDVAVDSNNQATISAYTEEPGANEGDDPVRTPVRVSVTIAQGSANSASDIGGTDSVSAVSQISNATKISDLGAAPDENGMYGFEINGQKFSFDGNTTVNDMMKKVNASSAGVKMTYSSLDNAFTLTSNKYGLDTGIDIKDGSAGLLGKLGVEDGSIKNGSNLVMEINGKTVESNGNSVEVDGTTFTFTGGTDQVGQEFTVSIGRDTSAVADVIKGFVKEYNQLIGDVYKYLDEKPEKDYYFLADQDKEDLDLSDKQEEKWEEKAKKGLLYHDSTVSTAMSKLRTALMGSIEALDGNTFSLSSLGIKTSTDYSKHGILVIDEKALNDAVETHADDIQKLFTDSENGIMKKFSEAIDFAVGTKSDSKGTLIKKAGLKSGTSSTDNELYNLIKRTKTNIASLTKKYENEQNRLWKRYSAMESMLGTLNSQQSSFNSYFGGMM